jgi:DNA processing protein
MSTADRLQDNVLLACLQLARTRNIGPITFQRLLQIYTTPQAALAALPELSLRGGPKTALKIASLASARDELATTRAHQGEYLIWGQAGYPGPLSHIADAPIALAAFGHLSLLKRPIIAMVGSRNASAAGQRLAQELSQGLSRHGIVVVSGLARGIDTVAHRHAIDGGTIAVLGNGISHTYPLENKELQEKIIAGGLVLSENHPDAAPQASQFPRRNRIISGLASGVLIVEAARRSGSLITARLANEQGREVMAVPGSPLDPRCHGSNNLLREGAYLIETIEDVLTLIQPQITAPGLQAKAPAGLRGDPRPASTLTQAQRLQITRLLGPVPITIDALVSMSGLSVPLVYLAVLELQIAGRLTQEANGKISLLDG